MELFIILTIGIYSYLFIWTTYLFFFSLAGLFYKQDNSSQNVSENRYAILIPAYKEDEVILSSVLENLNVDFPKERFSLFVLADSLHEKTLLALRKMQVTVVPISFEKSTKAKAINKALNTLDLEGFTHVLILDADNVMKSNFLQTIDSYPDNVLMAAQAHRTAKNQQSTMAFLDAINEEIGNHIFRKGHRAMGLSSALIGSAMVFEIELYKRLMTPIADTAGEDKMLEFALLDEKIKVEYLADAFVYDEKVSTKEQFSGQRTRWIAARFYFLKHYAGPAFKKLLQGDVDYFNKWLQFLLPQKIMLIAYVMLFWVISVFVPSIFLPATLLLAMLTFAMLLAVPKKRYSLQLVKAIFSLPSVVFRMIFVMLKARKADPSHFNVTQKVA